MPDASSYASDQEVAPETTHVSYMWAQDPRSRRLVTGRRDPTPLLVPPSRCHAAENDLVTRDRTPDLGDLVVILLASTLAGLRDRLAEDGFDAAADLVADLADVADHYLTNIAA